MTVPVEHGIDDVPMTIVVYAIAGFKGLVLGSVVARNVLSSPVTGLSRTFDEGGSSRVPKERESLGVAFRATRGLRQRR
jgi:hypothetical protein